MKYERYRAPSVQFISVQRNSGKIIILSRRHCMCKILNCKVVVTIDNYIFLKNTALKKIIRGKFDQVQYVSFRSEMLYPWFDLDTRKDNANLAS